MAAASSYKLMSNQLVHHDFPVPRRRRDHMIISRSISQSANIFNTPGYNSHHHHLQISNLSLANDHRGRLSALGGINHGALIRKSYRKMDVTVCASVQPGFPLPTPPPSSHSWKSWVLGVILSIILPLWRNKSAPFLAIKKEVDMVVETIDSVAEVIEMVAEEVEKVAEQVADQLPEGGLKNAVTCVEIIAKEAAKDAHLADEFLDKVVEVEKEMLNDLESKTKSE